MRRSGRASDAGFDLTRVVASMLLGVLVLTGVVVLALPLVFRLRAVRARIETTVAKLVKDETNLDVRLTLARPLWPPGVVVRDVSVDGLPPGRPFASLREARVTLRPFSLLSGKVALASIELDGLDVDLDLVDGRPSNLPLRLRPHPPTPKSNDDEPPFRLLAVTGAHVRASIVENGGRPIVVDLGGIDLDVDVDAAPDGGNRFDVRLQKAGGALHTPRISHLPIVAPERFDHDAPKKTAAREVTDDDAICNVAASVLLTDGPQRTDVELRRFELEVRVDDFDDPGSEPSCAGAAADEHLLAVRLERISARLPKQAGKKPQIVVGSPTGKVRVRAPALVAARYLQEFPPIAGWAMLDLDVASTIDLDDPLAGVLRTSVDGKLEAAEIRLDQFRMGTSIHGDLYVRPGLVVGAKKIAIGYADGTVTLSDVETKLAPNPTAKERLPLKATVDIAGVTFPGLMRELGVARKAHVRWDIDQADAKISGFLDPLKLDGELVAKTKGFELTNGPVELPTAPHLIGVTPRANGGAAALATHVAIRPAGLSFENINVAFGTTRIRGRTLIGFKDELEVDATADPIDLSDISPLAKFPLAGVGKANVKITGKTNDPIGEGTASFDGFVFDVFPLGNLDSVVAHFRGQSIELSGIEALYGESRYAVPSMRIDLAPRGGGEVTLDALVKSDDFQLDDLYDIFKMREDPRWKDIQGHLAFSTAVHLAAGGPDDPCGTAHLGLDLDARVLALDLFGERFDGGAAQADLDWWDFNAGGLGMDLTLRAATLKKKGGGTIVTSGRIDRGGKLNLAVTASAVSLASLSSMPTLNVPVDARIDATANVGGTFDTMAIDADVYANSLMIGEDAVGRSHLHVKRTPTPGIADPPPPDARGCYRGRRFPPFDLARYQSDPVEGEYSITGEMLDGAVAFSDLRVTDARNRVARGNVSLRALPLGPLVNVRLVPASVELDPNPPKPATPIKLTGKLSAEVALERYPISAWWTSRGVIDKLAFEVQKDDVGVATDASALPSVRFSPDGFAISETKLLLELGAARTSLVLEGSIDNRPTVKGADGSPLVRGRIELPSLPLAKLTELSPRLERADGRARAMLSLAGTLAAPTWSGQLALENGAFTVKGLGVPITAVNGLIDIDPKTGLRITKLHGEVGGGTVDISGGAALDGFGIGDVDVKIAASGVHLRYGDGISATIGADLRTTWSPPEKGAEPEPFRLAGVVDVESFLYEREVKVFDVGAFQSAKRTEVDVYDPANDKVLLDIEVRGKSGLRVKNGLVDAQVAIGKGGLHVSGTNQKFGVIGAMSVVPGGVFRIRQQQFDIREGSLTFDDDTKIDPRIDLVAYDDYRRQASTGSASEWRIRLHAYGTGSDLKLELTSEPALSQDDILALLTLGVTRAELGQLGANAPGLSLLSEALGVNQTLRQAIPVIDDFAFGQAYSVKTGRSEPNITIGKRITDSIRASVTSGISDQDRTILAGIEWRLSRSTSLRGTYDNANDVTSASVGNIGIELRWRIEFE